MQGMENARKMLHFCRVWKMQGMGNGRKEKTGKYKKRKMQEIENVRKHEYLSKNGTIAMTMDNIIPL